jgi:hypothetical protein
MDFEPSSVRNGTIREDYQSPDGQARLVCQTHVGRSLLQGTIAGRRASQDGLRFGLRADDVRRANTLSLSQR